MGLHQGIDFSRQLTVHAEQQIRLDAVLRGRQPRFLEPDDHRGGEAGAGELGQRRPAPQAERLAQPARRARRVLPVQRRTSLRHQLVKAGGVQGTGRNLQGIAPAARADAIVAQGPAEPGDLDLETVAVRELLALPHLVEKLIGGHRMAACQRQGGEECLGSQPADVQGPAIVPDHFERPEDPELHACPC